MTLAPMFANFSTSVRGPTISATSISSWSISRLRVPLHPFQDVLCHDACLPSHGSLFYTVRLLDHELVLHQLGQRRPPHFRLCSIHLLGGRRQISPSPLDIITNRLVACHLLDSLVPTLGAQQSAKIVVPIAPISARTRSQPRREPEHTTPKASGKYGKRTVPRIITNYFC